MPSITMDFWGARTPGCCLDLRRDQLLAHLLIEMARKQDQPMPTR